MEFVEMFDEQLREFACLLYLDEANYNNADITNQAILTEDEIYELLKE